MLEVKIVNQPVDGKQKKMHASVSVNLAIAPGLLPNSWPTFDTLPW